MTDKTKAKIETVKATAAAINNPDVRIDGQTVGEVIKQQVKQQHS